MSLRIGHNGEAQAVARQLDLSSARLSSAMQRITSGLRIVTAADDAAGLTLSERMRAQVRGLEVAGRNIQEGISMLNTLDGVLDTVTTVLQRARELAVQYSNDSYSAEERQAISIELIALSDEVARIEASAEYTGIALLQSASATVTLQVGANAGDEIAVQLVDLFGPALSLVRPISFFVTGSSADIAGLDQHIQDVSTARGRVGAIVNRLEHALTTNQTQAENLMQSESRVRDVDMAAEMSRFTRAQILVQGGSSMLVQANENHRSRIGQLLQSIS